ncbi:MAG: formylmethanofuran dehydrogenase subunit C [Planctomycetales bacterium]|nr:formylmethanofuran dehydrogenase subunit C [Planctomycetales bacterium]
MNIAAATESPPVTFRLRRPPTVPLEAETLTPDVIERLSNAEIRSLIVYHGKRQLPLSEFFDVEGERSDRLELHGDLNKVRWIGRAMSHGSITVHGRVGMHLGAYMRGGEIEVHGDAGDWVGAEMKHGFIRVRGNAGGQVGAAYRGSLAGMKNGLIIIDGTAGLEVGMRMRRGTIVIGGRAKDFVGLQMKGGTIVLLEGAEIRAGAWMNRGTIISLQPIQLMPTFAFAAAYNPMFMHILSRHLQPHGIALPCAASEGSFQLFSGDLAVPGKGELFVWEGQSPAI